jgi:hypothetical protein
MMQFKKKKKVLISLWLSYFTYGWLAAQPKEFFLDGLKKLEQRSHKCVELRGDYVECLKMQLNGNKTSQQYRTVTSKKKGGTSLRGPQRTPNNTPVFCFNRKGTMIQTILVQDLKY